MAQTFFTTWADSVSNRLTSSCDQGVLLLSAMDSRGDQCVQVLPEIRLQTGISWGDRLQVSDVAQLLQRGLVHQSFAAATHHHPPRW